MRPFRFRAQAALQLRRREHDQALRQLAQAQTALTVAQRDLDTADAALGALDARLRQAMRERTSGHELDWYRSWRVRCVAEREAQDHRRRACETALHDAARAVAAARQKVRSLEHLHDRALAAWRREAEQEERKTMDALATARFLTNRKDTV